MTKRMIDLSTEELAAMGAKAARAAAQRTQNDGLAVTGTVTIYERGQANTSLAQLHPSGTVTLIRQGSAAPAETPAGAGRGRDKAAD